MPVETADEDHYFVIAEKLAGGRMIPFLGAGANLCDRGDETWEQGGSFLPSGRELAAHLAEQRPLSGARGARTCCASRSTSTRCAARTSCTATCARSSTPSTRRRRSTVCSRGVARQLSEAGLPQLLVVTTNYDDLVERALDERRLEFDVVWYEAKQDAGGARPLRASCAGRRSRSAIEQPNKYTGLPHRCSSARRS